MNIFGQMQTTESFEIFPNEESKKELARARWLRREGRIAESEAAYRGVMQRQPTLRSSWTECFDLLRTDGRADEALQLADGAVHIFPNEAFPLTLKGAALIEMQRYRDALQSLEVAVERDPDLALTWHELGYASFKLGDQNRALLSLDRAFALEPHTETLILRGRILRDAGELYAAEVAFEAARHSASHDPQQAVIEHEIEITRRAGAFPPAWIREPTAGEKWFTEHGAIVIATEVGEAPPDPAELERGLIELITDRGWAFGGLASPDNSGRWSALAESLNLSVSGPDAVDPATIPLMIAENHPDDNTDWRDGCHRILEEERGLIVVLNQPLDQPGFADVVCALRDEQTTLPLRADGSTAVVMAQHPAARIAHRRLG